MFISIHPPESTSELPSDNGYDDDYTSSNSGNEAEPQAQSDDDLPPRLIEMSDNSDDETEPYETQSNISQKSVSTVGDPTTVWAVATGYLENKDILMTYENKSETLEDMPHNTHLPCIGSLALYRDVWRGVVSRC